MQHVERPQSRVLKGEEAAAALEEYIRELKENRPEELTESQAGTVIKLAEGLLSAVQEDTLNLGNVEESTLLPKIKHLAQDVFSALKSLSNSGSEEPRERPRNDLHHSPSDRLV